MTTYTALQSALIAQGTSELSFTTGGMEHKLSIADLPDTTIARILAYGTRMFNDTVNSKVHNGADREKAAQEWLDKAKKGELGTRTATSPQGEMDKARSQVVEQHLRKHGWKAIDAKKDARKDAQGAFRTMLEKVLAAGKALTGGEVTPDEIQTAFDKNWPKVEAAAKRMVEAANADDGIDLG